MPAGWDIAVIGLALTLAGFHIAVSGLTRTLAGLNANIVVLAFATGGFHAIVVTFVRAATGLQSASFRGANVMCRPVVRPLCADGVAVHIWSKLGP